VPIDGHGTFAGVQLDVAGAPDRLRLQREVGVTFESPAERNAVVWGVSLLTEHDQSKRSRLIARGDSIGQPMCCGPCPDDDDGPLLRLCSFTLDHAPSVERWSFRVVSPVCRKVNAVQRQAGGGVRSSSPA
jgi:hypothetical protein